MDSGELFEYDYELDELKPGCLMHSCLSPWAQGSKANNHQQHWHESENTSRSFRAPKRADMVRAVSQVNILTDDRQPSSSTTSAVACNSVLLFKSIE